MESLERGLSTTYKAAPVGGGKNIIIFVNNGFDAEGTMPGTNTKTHTVDLLQELGARSIKVKHPAANGTGY